MTEKHKSEKMTNSSKPVPMKLFAVWEVDRTPSNCIPRLCTLRITRLRVTGLLGGVGDAAGATNTQSGGVTLAARMHSSKRILRSNDIIMPPYDVELDLCFSLQYPHFVKRDGNKLQIMLQRRKKYKNRTILGYKTLAEGVIRMDQVLQRSMDMELELIGVSGKGGTGGGGVVAKISITGLASTPVLHESKNNNTFMVADRGDSEEEEEGEFSSVEETDDMTYPTRRTVRQIAFNKADLSYTKLAHNSHLVYMGRPSVRYMRSKPNEKDSDSDVENRITKRKERKKLSQRNLKQKFAALLKRFKVPEELGERAAARATAHGALEDGEREIDELFQELESLSCEGDDSGPEQLDTISIGSTPKPSLRPFFSSSRSLAAPIVGEGQQQRTSVLPIPVSRRSSAAGGVHQQNGSVPEERSWCSEAAGGTSDLSDGETRNTPPGDLSSSPHDKTQEENKKSRLFRSATSGGNIMATQGIRKKNSLSTDMRPLSGHDFTIQSPTSLDCQQWSSNDCETWSVCSGWWCGVATSVGSVSIHSECRAALSAVGSRRPPPSAVRLLLCSSDVGVAAALKAHTELHAKRSLRPIRYYIVPIGPNTVSRHLSTMDPIYSTLFTNESWTTLCEKANDITEQDVNEASSRISRYLNYNGPTSNLPIGEAMVSYKEKMYDEDCSQTFIPFIAEVRLGEESDEGSPPGTPDLDTLDLQLDYWQTADGASEPSKVSVKGAFKYVQVLRQQQHLYLSYLTKEKKQKIMRLGKKKEKERECESGRARVSRLICSTRHAHAPLKIYIDGVEWNSVKFFQLSTQWQTSVKHFPVAMCNPNNDT